MTEKVFDSLLWTVFAIVLYAALWIPKMTSTVAAPTDSLVTQLGLDASEPLEVLVQQQQSTASLDRFMGGRVRNVIHTAQRGDQLLASLRSERRWDVVAVLVERAARDARIDSVLADAGYVVLFDDQQSLIALPNERLHIVPLIDTDALEWQPYAALSGAVLDASSHHPAVESASPVDAGFISQPLALAGKLLVEARIKGAVTGAQAHAAHISIFGQRAILLFGSGSYDSSQRFRAVIDQPAAPAVDMRIAFGLGGWAEGAGQVRLEGLTVSRIEIAAGAIAGSDRAPASARTWDAPGVFALMLAVLLASSYLGQRLLWSAGLRNATLLGSGLLFGLCLLSATLLLSLRTLHTQMAGGALLAAILVVVAIRQITGARRVAQVEHEDRRPLPLDQRHAPEKMALLDLLIKVAVAAWVAYIAVLLFPAQLMATAPQYPFPAIFDLPKNLFAVRATFDADSWPPQNPFFAGEAFAYNFGFHMPAAFVAKLLGSRVATLQTFAITTLAVALALPLFVLELTRSITRSKGTQFACVLLATWVGGLTPLWLTNHAGLGGSLVAENLVQSFAWSEEMVTYVLYVPQHLFAALCALLSVYLLLGAEADVERDVERLICAAVVAIAGAVSSLLILPYIVLSYFFAGLFVIVQSFRRHAGKAARPARRVASAGVLIAPLVLLLPFVVEAAHWSSGKASLLSWPSLTRQWFYISTSFGIVLLLALVGLPALLRRGRPPAVIGIAGIALLGLGGVLAGGSPDDVGLKAALLVRIALVPLAGVGIMVLRRHLANERFVTHTLTALCACSFAANLPMLTDVMRRALAHVDPASGRFVEYVRALPEGARIAIFSTDQATVALFARQVDFDFSATRADSYMRPEGRQHAKAFWDGVAAGTPDSIDTLKARYDFAIAPLDSGAYKRLSNVFSTPTVAGSYAVFRTHVDGR